MDIGQAVTLVEPIVVERGQWVYVSLCSDLHCEKQHFNQKRFLKDMHDRNALGIHRGLLFGDLWDAITPSDPRFGWKDLRGHERTKAKQGVWNHLLDEAENLLAASKVQWDMISPGNHETSALKHGHMNLLAELNRRNGIPIGGFEGRVRYRLVLEGKGRQGFNLDIVYAHGRWGGKTKGYIAAQHFFSQRDDWQVACYGHNHTSQINRDSRLRVKQRGKREKYDVYIVNTGTYVERPIDGDGGEPSYGDVACYRHNPIGSPLLMMRINSARYQRGKNAGYTLEYKVV